MDQNEALALTQQRIHRLITSKKNKYASMAKQLEYYTKNNIIDVEQDLIKKMVMIKNKLEFLQGIYDDLNSGKTDEIQKYANVIYRDCQPYLTEIDNNVKEYKLYRGMRANGIFQITKSRLTNRAPMHTTSKDHRIANKIFTELYGHPFRNAPMVTGSFETAESYGTPYIVYPIGEFDYLWSPKIDDFTDAISVTMHAISGRDDVHKNMSDSDREQLIRKMIEDADYKTTDLKSAIKSNNEIMIWCDKYYAVHYAYAELIDLFLQILFDDDVDKDNK